MRVASVGAGHGTGNGHPRTAQPHPLAPLAAERSLVALSPAPPRPAASATPGAQPRPQAAFLAHLIAVAADLPQTRQRRRAEPEAAIASYTDASQNGKGSSACSVAF